MSQKRSFAENTSNVFVANLNRKINKKALQEIFSAFGAIRHCEIARGPGGAPKGYGFVHYESETSAAACIAELNGSVLLDKKITVEYASPREQRHLKVENTVKTMQSPKIEPERRDTQLSSVEKGANLYVYNLDSSIDSCELRQIFSPFGTVKSAKVVSKAGRHQGYGFVQLTTTDEAIRAIRAMHGMEVKNKVLQVSVARSQSYRGTNQIAQTIAEIVEESTFGQLIQSPAGGGLVLLAVRQDMASVAKRHPNALYVSNLLIKDFFGPAVEHQELFENRRIKLTFIIWSRRCPCFFNMYRILSEFDSNLN